MAYSIASITFLVGLALIVIALLGGGLEVKEIKLPVLGIFPRLLSFVMGTVLVSLALFGRDILPEGTTPAFTPSAPKEAKAINPDKGKGTSDKPDKGTDAIDAAPRDAKLEKPDKRMPNADNREGGKDKTDKPDNETTAPAAVSTLWIQNGSIMSLVSKEDAVEINYESPTVEMQSLGIIKGTLKFQGRRNGLQYNGIAYVYSAYCSKGFDYYVKGDETEDHLFITLKGKAPVRTDNTCRVHHYDDKAAGSILRFEAYDRGITGRAYAKDKRETRTNSIH